MGTRRRAWQLVVWSILSVQSLIGCDKPPKGGGIYVSEFTLRERVLGTLPPKVELPASIAEDTPFVFELDISISDGTVLAVRHLLDLGQYDSEIVKQSLSALRFRISDLTSKGSMTGRLTFYTKRGEDGSVRLRDPRFSSIMQEALRNVQAASTPMP